MRFVGVRAVVAVALLSSGCAAASAPDTAGSVNEPTATLQLEPCVAPPAAAAVPDGPPDTELRCLVSDGRFSLSAIRTPTLINVWASWCLPCRQEMPMLQAAHETAGAQPAFLGVNVSDQRSSAVDFLTATGVTYSQAVDPTNLLPSQLGSPGLPVTIVVDSLGAVVYRKIGPLSEADLAEALDAAGG